MNILSELASAMTGAIASKKAVHGINKDDLAKVISTNIDGHQGIVSAMGAVSDKDMATTARDLVLPAMRQDAPQVHEQYLLYVKSLTSKAKSDEAKCPYTSMRYANEKIIPILREIEKKLDDLFENDNITLFNIRMSQAAIIGIIRQSNILINYTTMMFSVFTSLATDTYGDAPKYRQRYVMNHTELVSKVVSNIYDKKGPYTILAEINAHKKEHIDVVLGATGKFDFVNYLHVRKFSISFLDNIAAFLSTLNFFSAAMDAWDDYLLDKHARNKETAEWLRGRVVLLRMRLDDIDPTSPEYQNQIKIITAYEEKITDYDSRIIAFEQGD